MKKQKKNSNIQKNEEINQIIKLEIYHKNRLIPIKRDRDWNIDITDAAKSLDKKWQDWYKYHKKKIQYFEAQSGIKQIVRATRGRYGSTWITFELAIQVLNSWSNSFSYQLSCAYKIWVLNLRKQVSEFNLLIKNQQQRKRRYLLGEGPCIYCYTTNGLRKIGSSTGKHRRIKSHETSVAN